MDRIKDKMPLSPDWNEERLAKLKELMPDIFTNEGKLNINELKKVIDPELVNETERYEFRWFGKSKAKREAFTPTDATLVYDDERSVNPENSENIIIEGENLAVLKLLSNAYREKIKCIYIDPPYNTGKDFVYSDKWNQDKAEYWEDAEYVENGMKVDTNAESDGRFHSNWLNMMYSRLLIARQLLKEDGVIFISIDDSEVFHLRKLCNLVFGEENFVEEIIWRNKLSSGALTKGFSNIHEYILCYSKNKLQNIEAPLDTDAILKYNKKDDKFSVRGGYVTQALATNSKDDRPNLVYPVMYKGQEIWPNKQWLWQESRIKEAIENDNVVFNKDGDTYNLRVKQYLKDESGNIRKTKPNSILIGPYNQEGKKEITELFSKAIFDFPKPSNLLRYLASFSYNNENSKEDLYLDFFSGSGSLGQALFNLNQEDSGNRKFILVQLPEATDPKSEAYKAGYKKISDITIERNKRVIEKIIEEKESKQPDLFSGDKKEDSPKGLGFKVFKLQKSNFPRTEFAPDPEKTEEENIQLLKKYISEKEAQMITAFNKEELITEILIKKGYELNYTVTPKDEFKENEIFHVTDGNKETLICLDGTLENETVEYFKKNPKEHLIVLERALDTTKKWNLKHYMGDNFVAF